MELFWRARRKGERLILSSGPGQEEEVGGVRETKSGFDAFAKVRILSALAFNNKISKAKCIMEGIENIEYRDIDK